MNIIQSLINGYLSQLISMICVESVITDEVSMHETRVWSLSIITWDDFILYIIKNIPGYSS